MYTKPGLGITHPVAYLMTHPKFVFLTIMKEKTALSPKEQAFRSHERSSDGRHVFSVDLGPRSSRQGYT